MQALIPKLAVLTPPGRIAGSAVHKFTKYGLFSTLQALYILILLIMPCATCDKREKSVKKLGKFQYKWVKSLNFT